MKCVECKIELPENNLFWFRELPKRKMCLDCFEEFSESIREDMDFDLMDTYLNVFESRGNA